MIDEYIKLEREFVSIPETADDEEDFGFLLGFSNAKTWKNIHHEYRTVILAEAGAGKSKELMTQAKSLFAQGKNSFFIKIEDIVGDFKDAYEVGDEDLLSKWLESSDEAWFFLDSVDEAKLKDAGALSKALTKFANVIKGATDRAHVVLSSRPYSWLSHVDRALMDDKLFKPKPHQGPDVEGTKLESSLVVYKLLPLDEDRVRLFCGGRGVQDIELLISQIGRKRLWTLAERPFDLDAIISTWKDNKTLKSRFDLFKQNINKRLSEAHNIIKAQNDPLNLEMARMGARRLAAAVVLTGISNIKTPDSTADEDKAIDAAAVLGDWEPNQVLSLLNRGIFNDILFSSVRFRHQEIKEILAAEWFIDLLHQNDPGRFAIEDMFFKESYGEQIITPKLRALLPWIILDNVNIQERVLQDFPEIIVEGGDPSLLEFPKRKSLLNRLVESIANDEEFYRYDSTSIARIANIDLSDETKSLIRKHEKNDDVINYLGRLVWQGEMTDCLDLLTVIAEDNTRSTQPRVVSIRAVMSCGTEAQKISLWQNILNGCKTIPKDILLELFYWAPGKSPFVRLVLDSLLKMPRMERYKGIGVNRGIKRVISKCNENTVVQFIEGAGKLINKKPYLKDIDCVISARYAILINPLSKAIEKLVLARHPFALDPQCLSIMHKIPELRFWTDGDYNDDESELYNLVPDWHELNDALYWSAVERAADGKEVDVERALPDDATFFNYDHFWKFDREGIFRLIGQIKTRSKIEEQCVAISSCHRVYSREDNSENIRSEVTDVCSSNTTLSAYHHGLLNPQFSEELLELQRNSNERSRVRAGKLASRSADRSATINSLKVNPKLIIQSLGTSKADFSPILNNLFYEVISANHNGNSYDGGNWRYLINEFGTEVAEVYREALITVWRNYRPTLQSEGDPIGSLEPSQIRLGLAGIAIESRENIRFFSNLSVAEANHLLRYLTWGPSTLNPWVGQIYASHPSETLEAVTKEMIWELDNCQTSHGLSYILSKIVYSAPYIHTDLAPVIYDWALKNPVQLNFHRKHCVRILINVPINVAKIADLAAHQIQQSTDDDSIAWWYSVLIDTRPEVGILQFRSWLETLSKEAASEAAQQCVVSLLGGEMNRESGPYVGLYKKAEFLQALYSLLNQFIPFKDYRARINDGSYLSGFRGDAEEAIGSIFRMLVELPGKASYLALKQLAKEAPESARRDIENKAFARALEDGDIKWSGDQVLQFHKHFNIVPQTHKQLFELTRRRLIELKNELERANDSPWRIWQRAEKERDMSTLVVHWLNNHCGQQFVTAKEPEIANEQRMDIWVQNTYAKPPVPIELKLLDKGWSGRDLCDSLRDQLTADYLREEGASCGVLLLVSQKLSSTREWDINAKMVTLTELAGALKGYWRVIQDQFPKVHEIEVVVIDLSLRGVVNKGN